MPFKLSEPIETKRLYIRQFTQEDYELLVSKLNNAFPEEDYQFFSYFKERDVSCVLLLLRESQEVIGYIFLRTFEELKIIECYLELFPLYTGNGFAIEALRKLYEYIFTNHKFIQILAFVEPGNTRGWKAVERSGMKYMGDMFHTGKNSKVMYFLINKKDYDNQFQY